MEEKNEIIEIDENEEITNTQYDLSEVVEVTKKKKEKKPSKWSKLSKKKKIIIIVSISVLLLLILGIVVYFVFFKKSSEEEYNEPMIVIEKDNYKYVDGKLIFINNDKKEIGTYTCENKSENLCYLASYSNEDDFDTDKRVYESGLKIDNKTDILLDNYVFIYDDETKENGGVFLYDISKDEVVGEYDLVKEVSETQVIFKKDNKYGLLSVSDKGVSEDIKNTYDYMGYILNTDYLVVSSNNNYKLIDFEDKAVSKSVPGVIKNFDGNNLSVCVGSDYFVYDYSGKMIVDTEYDYIRFVSDYIIAASGKKLYVYDKDGTPMNMDGVRINSNDYNTKLIFNENLRQIGKEEAFSVTITSSAIRISYGDESADINLMDGALSKEISYVSYYGGKLYFYEDEEKTDLIGTYTCKYANSDSLGNCFLAKESSIISENIVNDYLPIINNRYVFISDTKEPNKNDNIILYDLKDKKTLATYTEVDMGYHTEGFDSMTTAGTYVVAKNTSNSYGVINIESSKVSGIIPFKNGDDGKVINETFKMLDSYYLFKRSDGTYHLYPSTGNNINSNEITKNVVTKYEIVEYKYNYLKVKNNDKYLIYALDGKIVSDEIKNIIMEDSFYIGIDNSNIVSVYKYDKTKLEGYNTETEETEEIRIDGVDYTKELSYTKKGNLLTLTTTFEGKTSNYNINLG